MPVVVKISVWQPSVFCCCCCLFVMSVFSKSNRYGTHFFDKLSICVLNSHLDPIGGQHDVRYLSMFVNILYMFGISGTGASHVFAIGNEQ